MVSFLGVLKKMWVINATPIVYYLNLGNELVCLNQLLNLPIKLEFTGHYQCGNCQKDLPIYAQSYCKNCFFIVPQTNANLFKPELSTAHLGIEKKDLEWEKQFELQPHVVYLSYTGGLKVGVTRKTQLPTRWIDQGAIAALPFAITNNRYEAGMIEVALTKQIADKTHYKRMLLTTTCADDLVAKKQILKELIPEEMQDFYVQENNLSEFIYPITQEINKIDSFSFKNTSCVEDVIVGIKGQYLLFKSGKAINIRNHEGYKVELTVLKNL